MNQTKDALEIVRRALVRIAKEEFAGALRGKVAIISGIEDGHMQINITWEADMDDEKVMMRWACTACGNVHWGYYPKSATREAQECPACNRVTAEPTFIEDDEEE